MKKLSKLTAVVLALALLCSVSANASVVAELTQEEILELIMSGDNYLVGDGVPFDNPNDSGITPLWTAGGSNHTHQYILSYGFNILYNDYPSAYNWYISLGAVPYVLEGSDLPDDDEKDNSFAGHFYNPNTGKNYQGTTDTAKSRFFARYEQAVFYYESGQYAKAWEYLGRAIHYLEDMNATHHTANLIAIGSNHMTFEQQIDRNRTRYTATTAMGKYTASISSIPDICAINALNQLEDATSAEDLTTFEPWLRAGDNTVPVAMQYVAVVLHKFQQEVS